MPLERLKSRYEIKAQLGAGGMGVVYRAWDLQAQREVAIKTIRDTHSQSALDLFRKELHFQKTLNHPNIVDIFDIGEFEMEGRRIPYFVMPLLPGQTLDRVIRNERISMSRCLEIVNQVARGLQALHDKALVHRDLKPSNIFILPGDSVKIIDFGLAHLIDRHSSVEVRGTLLYMSPEQIQMKPATYASDIFALGVICYEMLSGKHPFEAGNREEIIARILGGHPPALSQLNPSVSTAVSQAVHAAMAKRPSHRYTSVAEYAEILRKAAYNEPIERFNPARLEQRVERVRKALDEGDFSSAADVLNAIEAEGCLRQDIPALRRQVDHALRQQNMRQLLESARKRFLEHEHQLALGNLQELLNLDPIHAEALTLKATIEQDWRNSRIDTWFRVAREHASNREYALAREALHNVLQLSANDAEARRLLAEIDQDEAEYARMGEEKERLARAAAADRDRGDFDSAMAQLERLLRIEESHPAKGVEAGRSPYQKAYEETRAEAEALRNAYAEARQHLDQRRFAEARRTCEQYLSRYPDHVLFHTLKVDAEHAESRDLLNYIAQIDRELEAERDLERKIRILQDAIARTPVEHFQRSLESLQSRRDLVQKIVARARNLEDRAQYTEAISQWETLRTVYGDYPGLDAEIQRLQQLRQRESRQAAKSVATSQISRKLEAADFAAAAMLTDSALRDFPDDPELLALQRVASEGKERSVNAGRLFDESQRLFTEQRTQESLSLLRKAQAMDPQNTRIRTRLVELLVAQAQARLDSDPQSAEAYLQEALELDAQNPFAISCRRVLDERKSTAMVEQSLAQARALKAAGDFEGALAAIGRAIESNPQEPRLVELQATIYESMRTRQNQTRQRNLEEARDLQRQAANLMESDALQAVFARTQAFAAQHPGDPDFQNIAAEVQQRTMLFPAQERAAAPAPPPPVPAEPKKKPAVAAPGMLARAWAAWHRMVPRRRPRIMAYCLVLLLAVAPVVVLKWLPPPAPRTQAPKPVLVNLRAQPAQARVTLDGKPLDLSRPLEVQPGASHILRAELEGFAPKELRIDAGTRDPVLLILDPLPTVLKVVTDLGSGSVVLDENKSALENGGFLASTVPAGMHKLAIDGGSLWQVKEISFESVSGAAPKLASELQRYPNLRSVVVTSFRNQARVYCNFLPAKAKVEDREYEVTKEGVDIAIQPGQPFDLTFTGDARPIHVDVPAGPALFAFLSAGEYGALEISVSPVVEDVQIFVDGKPLTRKPDRRGKVTIYNVAPGAHAVRVASADYTVSPESQPLQLEKRGLASAKFALTAKPKFASLVIRGGPPGAQVSVEGHSGVIDAAGGLQIASIRPGMQKIEISKADFETRSLAKDFAAGGVVELGVEETRLLRPAFNATFRVTPPEAESKARLNILEAVTAPSGAREFRQRASGHDPKQPLRLRDGTFKVEAVAEGFSPWSSETTFSVATTFPYHIEMTRPAAKPVPTPAQPTWRTVPAGHVESLGQGAGPFQIMVRPKKRELTWHIGHIDDGNYEEYRLDKDKLRWRKVVNTRPSRPKEKNLGFNLPDEFALQIVVRGTTVEQRLGIAGQGARVLPELRDKTPVPDNGQVRVYLEGQILKP